MKGRMHMGKDNFRDTTDISQLPLRTINLVWLDNSGEFHANYPESIASTIRNCRSPVEPFLESWSLISFELKMKLIHGAHFRKR
jgi:hypothetical protein